MSAGHRSIECPGCGAAVEWSEANPYRPFCSHRCRLMDLGAWAQEEHHIPGEPALDAEDEAAMLWHKEDD